MPMDITVNRSAQFVDIELTNPHSERLLPVALHQNGGDECFSSNARDYTLLTYRRYDESESLGEQ